MDFVIINGDQAIFDQAFPPAMVVAPPGVISGSGRSRVNKLLVCVEGDEATVVVAGASYSTVDHPIAGI